MRFAPVIYRFFACQRNIRAGIQFTASFFLAAMLSLSVADAAEPTINTSIDSLSDVESAGENLSLRDALFDELARDANRFQEQYGIVKRVVKLVRPTIVHIDAYAASNKSGGSDEAGSGIIIRSRISSTF